MMDLWLFSETKLRTKFDTIKEIAALKAENTAVIYSGKNLPATKESGAYICWREI